MDREGLALQPSLSQQPTSSMDTPCLSQEQQIWPCHFCSQVPAELSRVLH